jgi:uncharacterized protein
MAFRLAKGLVPASFLVVSACIARNAPPDRQPTAAPVAVVKPPVAPAAAVPVEVVAPPSAPPDYIAMHASAVVATREGEVVLLLDESETVALPIFIGGSEATSIRWRLEKRRYERPLTHDLLDALLREVGARLEKVQVDDLKSSTFIGSIFVRVGGRVIELDARPSDAIALAIGSRAPIFVACRVLATSAIPHASPRSPAAPADELHVPGCAEKPGGAAKTTASRI